MDSASSSGSGPPAICQRLATNPFEQELTVGEFGGHAVAGDRYSVQYHGFAHSHMDGLTYFSDNGILEPGVAITSEDLEAWEAKTNVTIGSGDVLLIWTGRWERLRQKGQWNFLEEAAGSHASVARWLKASDVAVIGSDGVSDVIPSGVEGLVNPLHELVLVSLGMPLRVPGGTGSPLNPLAIFSAETHSVVLP